MDTDNSKTFVCDENISLTVYKGLGYIKINGDFTSDSQCLVTSTGKYYLYRLSWQKGVPYVIDKIGKNFKLYEYLLDRTNLETYTIQLIYNFLISMYNGTYSV